MFTAVITTAVFWWAHWDLPKPKPNEEPRFVQGELVHMRSNRERVVILNIRCNPADCFYAVRLLGNVHEVTFLELEK